MKLFTKSFFKVATGYERIVTGCRGSYIEFNSYQLIKNRIRIHPSSEWRLKYNCFYIEYRTKDISFVKIYYQLKEVDYADYKVGFYYISIFDLVDCNRNLLVV